MSFRYEKALELMELAHANERFAHAYLIMGPPGSGKEKLAIRMMEMVNEADRQKGATTLEALRSSTTTVIGPESKSRRITVDAIRALEHTLHMAAPAGVTKFAIVQEADRMGQEAENAFLKTLEEPPQASRLLLLTSRPEMLLETILSRCIRVTLSGSITPAAFTTIEQSFLDSLRDHAVKGVKGISGALGLMSGFTELLKQEKAKITKENEAAEKAEVAHYKNKTEGNYLKQREEHYKAHIEVAYLELRNRLIEYLVMWFGDAMRQQHGVTHLDLPGYAAATATLAKRFSIDELSDRIDAVEDLRANLNTNVFEALALEVGFIRAFG
ncbi:MAG: ATP-binding protein [Verrucomicrobiales bacterium]|jgi:DNA polymerase-3 subunit delta'|nr:ATP-binding protein [Verrucomicrobiales bacterium]MBP9224104.1 ATP-binding protein [Verrucomicrobiales bacterium]